MATKLSADSFLAVVRQSGLVDESQLKKFWQGFQQSGKDVLATETIASGLVDSQLLTRWQIEKLLLGKHKGFFLGKYKLLSLLGSGGMSAVYLAEHTLMKRRVAIKVLPQSRIADSSYLDRFHREAQAVATLDHPNIMRAYDVDQEGKVHFLVMEYIDGQSLLELVSQRGPLPYVEAAELMRQSAEGLDHAHARGMIHRDIKPGNILVDRKGVVKILDMGLAMFFDPTGKDDEQASLTIQHDERVLGTADYLSPEQALNSHNVDIRTDIYSLGCTFYFVLTGHPPFPEGSLAQRLLFHQTKAPAPIENDRPDAPASLVALLRKMMEKNQDNRYQTAREMYDAFTRWLIENGDSEWREKNSMVIAASGTGSNVLGNNFGSGVFATPSTGALPPTANPVVTAPVPQVAPVARPVQPISAQHQAPYPPPGSQQFAPPYLPGQYPPSYPPQPSGSFPQHSQTQTPADAPYVTGGGVSGGWPDYVPPQGAPQSGGPGMPPSSSGFYTTPDNQQIQTAPATGSGQIPGSQPAIVGQSSPEIPDFGVMDFGSAVQSGRTTKSDSSVKKSVSVKVPATKPKTDRKSSPAVALQKLFQSKSGKYVIGGIAAVICIAIGLGFYAFRGTTKKPTKAGKPALEYVVGEYSKYKTVADAITAIKEAGGVKPKIRVLGTLVYKERLDLTQLPVGTEILADVTGGPTLAPKGVEPILDLAGVNGLRIQGFILDAKGKEVGIRVAGAVPNLSLAECSLAGFTKHGILVEGAAGDETDRVSFETLKLSGADPGATGISINSGGGTPSYITIENCRLLGPMAAGIVLDTNAETISIERTIFSETTVGVRFQGADRVYKNVSLSNDTFYKLQQGIVLTNMPGLATERFGVFNCLFAEVKGAEFVVEQGYSKETFTGVMHSQVANNWTDKPALDPNAVIFDNAGQAATVYHFKSLKPSDPAFLAPTEMSPQRSAANAGPSEGYIGAVGPD